MTSGNASCSEVDIASAYGRCAALVVPDSPWELAKQPVARVNDGAVTCSSVADAAVAAAAANSATRAGTVNAQTFTVRPSGALGQGLQRRKEAARHTMNDSTRLWTTGPGGAIGRQCPPEEPIASGKHGSGNWVRGQQGAKGLARSGTGPGPEPRWLAAGDPRSSPRLDAEAAGRNAAGGDVQVVYSARGDRFLIVPCS